MSVLKRGLMAGLKTTWTLGKIIFPITLVITMLKYTSVLSFVTKLIAPFMGVIGLPGDAAIVLVLGSFLNLYAAIGAILTLELTVKEVFILAVMLSFAHNLLVESSVAVRVGVRLSVVLGVRLGLSFVSAMLIHLLWQGGEERAVYGFVSLETVEAHGWAEIVWNGVQTAALGIWQLALITLPLMVAIQFLKEYGFLAVFSRWVSPATRLLGMKENTSTTLAAGLLFGLAYGAGVMIQAVKEDGVEKRDLTLAFIFLVACHAVVEDTLLFVPLGIPIWPLFVIRISVAIVVTLVVSFIWKKATREELSYEH